MKREHIPKWEKEVQSFLGVKSCIILEGNVYDEYPVFMNEENKLRFACIDDLDAALCELIKLEKGMALFCDPILGFYSYESETETSILKTILADYNTSKTENLKQGLTYYRPTENESAVLSMSEIIRKSIVEYKAQDGGAEWIAFVINFASRLDACNDRQSDANEMFLNLMAASTLSKSSDSLCNMIIMVVDKYNDVPAWLYINNPNIRTISIGMPERSTRRLYLENLYGVLMPYSKLSEEEAEYGVKFVAETEGLRCREIGQILKLAYKMNIEPEQIHQASQLYKYGVLDNPWDLLEDDIMQRIHDTLARRVKGQEEARRKVEMVAARAVRGLSGLQHSNASNKPRGILFFAGPTGVGKTETAKAIAEAIFGDESACIRFDMSEYRLEQSDQKLFGAPPGYVGYEGGGQLTNEIKKHPFSVLLFDEIEKASPTILDKFLQILEDGRMTDNQGNTVYFGETIIIFTSNIGLTKLEYDEYGRPQCDETGNIRRVQSIMIEDPTSPDSEEFKSMVSQKLTQGVKDYFVGNGRPELLNRLGEDNIVVFQFIDKNIAEEICISKLDDICKTIRKRKGITLFTDDVVDMLKTKAVLERANGGRGVGNMLERELLNPLANYLCTCEIEDNSLRCYLGKNGQIHFRMMENGDTYSNNS